MYWCEDNLINYKYWLIDFIAILELSLDSKVVIYTFGENNDGKNRFDKILQYVFEMR